MMSLEVNETQDQPGGSSRDFDGKSVVGFEAYKAIFGQSIFDGFVLAL